MVVLDKTRLIDGLSLYNNLSILVERLLYTSAFCCYIRQREARTIVNKKDRR